MTHSYRIVNAGNIFAHAASFLILAVFLLFAAETGAAEKRLDAVRISESITLDGRLSESVWNDADIVDDFRQREPDEGAEPTERTEVRLLFDEEYLYIGVVCHDGEPDRIVNKELMWDGDIEGDDGFAVVLDTFSDRRTGFYFSTNPNGAMFDALIQSGDNLNEDWDGIWEVRSRVTEHGWTAEFAIPFMTLRFPKTEEQSWGVNFMRRIRRKNEEVLWTAWGREDGILQIAEAGRLDGMSGIRRGNRTELKPYILAGGEKKNGNDFDDTFKYGIDIKYPLTSDLTIDFTTKTDFAQVESDKEQVNLSRFSQNYPEKREFFLEGAEIFDFTQGHNTRLFYSRNIGITPDPDRQQVPILGGLKLSGKTGPYSIGVLSMQTEEETVTGKSGSRNVYPSTNYSAVRIKRDVLEQSYVGFIVTSVNRVEKPDNPLTGDSERDRFMNHRRNYFGAFDFGYVTSRMFGDKNFSVEGYFGATDTPGLSGGNYAGRFLIDYPNDLVDTRMSYHAIGENFNPELGFIRRTGFQEYETRLAYMPRVNIPYVRKLVFEPYNVSYMTDTGSKMLERTFEVQPIGLLFDTGDEIELERHYHYDYLDYDFNVFGDSIIPMGGYAYEHWMLSYESVKSRPVSADLSTSWGEYYNGRRTFYNGTLTFKPNRYVAISPDMSYYDISLKGDSFIVRRASVRLQANLSTRLTTSTFAQWNNENREVRMNFRVHYIPKIGSDFYLAYNQFWDEEDDMKTLYTAGVVKVNYLYRF